jgi:hypothetical protein
MPEWSFRIGDVFDAVDPMAVWLATLGVALNDLIHSNMKIDGAKLDWEGLYEWRVATGHFFEAGLHLRRGAEIPEVVEFIDSNNDLRELYDAALDSFDEVLPFTGGVRNQVAFHYVGRKGAKSMRKALQGLADTDGKITSPSGKLRDSRQEWADELTTHFVLQAAGGTEEKYKVGVSKLASAVNDFIDFANHALAELFRRKDVLER